MRSVFKRAVGLRPKNKSTRSRRDSFPLSDDDIEAEPLPRRRLDAAAKHGMPPARDGYTSLPSSSANEDAKEEHMDEMKELRDQERAKKKIASAKSGSHLVRLAEEHIDEDWLAKVDEMPGNMYYFMGFDVFSNDKDGILMTVARGVGCFAVWLIQIIGPPAVFLSSAFGIGIDKEDKVKWGQWEPKTSDWSQYHLTKLLGIVFIFCFQLNALFVVLDEYKTWKKIDQLFDYLQRITPQVDLAGEWWLWLGAFTNCWVVMWCCFASFICIGASTSPKDVCFDALSLLFLFNIDDLGGDLGFVSAEDWPGNRLGWICQNMVDTEWKPPTYISGAFEEKSFRSTMVEKTSICMTALIHFMYYVTVGLLILMAVALPVLAVFTDFNELVPED